VNLGKPPKEGTFDETNTTGDYNIGIGGVLAGPGRLIRRNPRSFYGCSDDVYFGDGRLA